MRHLRLAMQSDRMKRLITITATSALLTTPVQAALIYLTCKDLSATENGVSFELQTRPIFVDPDLERMSPIALWS